MDAAGDIGIAAGISAQAWEAVQGGYDLQVHVAPDIIERRTDDLDLARDFLARGLKGFVLKSHYIPTVERARVVARAVPGIRCHGGITLNHSVGGFNPVAVEIAGRSGGTFVWMPTVDAANETAGRTGGVETKLPFWATIQRELAAEGVSPAPLSPLDDKGRVSPLVCQCLERIAKHNMVLATGHLGRTEIFGLVVKARELGVKKIVITHAEFPSQNLTGDEQRQLADLGAVIEHCFTTTHTDKAPWEDVFRNVRLTGVERTILATDLGQTINPPVAEGFAMYAQRFLDAGFSVEEIQHMVAVLPARLLER
jgi:hypothetical protein